VDKGNTVIVIEHNFDVIKRRTGSSTWAGGRFRGGTVIAEGTPRDREVKDSYTAEFLRDVLRN